MKAREVKRAKLVAKYAEKRQALKEAVPRRGRRSRKPETGQLSTSSPRIPLPSVCTTVAPSPAVRKAT